MARGIKYRWLSSHYRYNVTDGVRIRFEILCTTSMESKVFAYRMLPINPTTGEAAGHFSHICSPVDLAEYPEDAPRVGYSPEWFRLDYVDVFVRSVTEAENFINIVRADIKSLKRTLDTMDVLFPGGNAALGAYCEGESSSSSSDSAADSASSASSGAEITLCTTGTIETTVGYGEEWVDQGTGAGSGVGSSDSAGKNYSRVTLLNGQSSKLLVVHGFDFSDLPDDAVIDGIRALLYVRDATELGVSASSSASVASISDAGSTCARLCYLSLQHPDFGLSQNKAVLECLSGPEWDVLGFGNDSDLWGYSGLSGKDLKRGDFGVSLIVGNDKERAPAIIDVDGVDLCISYHRVY